MADFSFLFDWEAKGTSSIHIEAVTLEEATKLIKERYDIEDLEEDREYEEYEAPSLVEIIDLNLIDTFRATYSQVINQTEEQEKANATT